MPALPKRRGKQALKSHQHFKTQGFFAPRCCSPPLRLWSHGLLMGTHTQGLPVMAVGKQLALPLRGPESVPPRCHVDPTGTRGQGKAPPPGRLMVRHRHQPRQQRQQGFCVELHQELAQP